MHWQYAEFDGLHFDTVDEHISVQQVYRTCIARALKFLHPLTLQQVGRIRHDRHTTSMGTFEDRMADNHTARVHVASVVEQMLFTVKMHTDEMRKPSCVNYFMSVHATHQELRVPHGPDVEKSVKTWIHMLTLSSQLPQLAVLVVGEHTSLAANWNQHVQQQYAAMSCPNVRFARNKASASCDLAQPRNNAISWDH